MLCTHTHTHKTQTRIHSHTFQQWLCMFVSQLDVICVSTKTRVSCCGNHFMKREKKRRGTLFVELCSLHSIQWNEYKRKHHHQCIDDDDDNNSNGTNTTFASTVQSQFCLKLSTTKNVETSQRCPTDRNCGTAIPLNIVYVLHFVVFFFVVFISCELIAIVCGGC